MNSVGSGRFLFVDALRGIAALGVVFYHLAGGNHIPLLTSALPAWIVFIFNHGNLGVAVFFVLSGFVIAHSVHGQRVRIPFAARFMLRRSLRLDPPYWVAIALTLGFVLLSTLAVSGKQLPYLSVGQITAHIFYAQEILGYPEINPVFWTLCLEVQFYLIYVLILAFGKNDPLVRMQGRGVAAILTISILVSLLWPTGLVPGEPWRGSFLPLWHGFLLGVGAYWSWRFAELRVFFAGFALIVAVAGVIRSDAFSFTCAAAASLIFAVALFGRLDFWLRWSWLQFLGAISYSLYLIHNPITGATFRVGNMLTGDTLIAETIWMLGALIACILSATALYYLVERPSIKLARMVDLKHSTLQTTPIVRTQLD